MRGCNNRIVFALTLAAMLAGWPYVAQAQDFGGCFITSYGDYVCPRGGFSGRITQKKAQKQPPPPASKAALSRTPVLSGMTTASTSSFVDAAMFQRCTDGLDNGNDGTADAADPYCAPVYDHPVYSKLAAAMNAAPAASRNTVNRNETNADRLRRITGSGGGGLGQLSTILRGNLASASAAAAQQLRPGGVPWMPSCTSTAPGRSFYVSPNGGGSSCSASSPCSLNAALSKAGPGDEVVLTDGTYRQKAKTVRAGTSGNNIVIRAENPHKAILAASPGRGQGFDISHDYITLSGIVVDGNKKCCWDGIRIQNTSRIIEGIEIENNVVRNQISHSFGCFNCRNVIIRNNLFQGTALDGKNPGEAMYLGSWDGKMIAENLQIYGNIIRDADGECIDMKPGTSNLDIHHNICEQIVQKGGSNDKRVITGVISFQGGRNINVHDNILRDFNTRGPGWTGAFQFFFDTTKNITVQNNVISNGVTGSLIAANSEARKARNINIHENVSCGLNTYSTGGNASSYNISNNSNNASASTCNAEEQRIMAEMQSLPSCQ